MKRFVLVEEPTNTWAVINEFSNVPAEHEGYVAVGLDKAEAIAFARAANAREALAGRKEVDESGSPDMPWFSAAGIDFRQQSALPRVAQPSQPPGATASQGERCAIRPKTQKPRYPKK